MRLHDTGKLVGLPVHGHEARLVGGVAGKQQFHRASQVAGLAQHLLVLFREIVPEIRAVQFLLLADAAHRQHDLPVFVRREGKAGVHPTFYQSGHVDVQGNQPVGLVSPQHILKQVHLLQHFLGHADRLQAFPVNHRLVIAVLLLRLSRSFFIFCHIHVFFRVCTLFLPLIPVRWDFMRLQEILHRIRQLVRQPVLQGLPVLLVVLDAHLEQVEMGGFFQLAPEVPDEIFQDARIPVKFQEGVLVSRVGGDGPDVPVLVGAADHPQPRLRVIPVADQQQFAVLFRPGILPRLRFHFFFVCLFLLCHNRFFCGFVISRANIGRCTAGADTGVIPCPPVSSCVREEDRKGRQTDGEGSAKVGNAVPRTMQSRGS